MYKPLALISLAFIDTATYSKFYQERRKELEIIDLGAEEALRDPNPSLIMGKPRDSQSTYDN